MTLEPQPQTHRFSACHRHPGDPITGFCASCLRERLSGLNPPNHLEISGGGCNVASSSSLLPELRRCKSLSVGKRGGFSGASEPRRNSCDVRARNTLWSLFNLDDERNGPNGEIELEKGKLGFAGNVGTVFEAREEEDNVGEIRVFEEAPIPRMNGIEKRDEEFEEEVELRTMKEHIDLEWQSRKHSGRDFKDIAGSFWVAASVFSRKLRKWRRKQKMKNRGRDPNSGGGRGGGGLVAMEVEKANGRHMRETQSEIGDYGFGRRSCDTDPRFSVDANRVSLDYPRYSFDEPRASWDGCLIGRTLPRLTPNVSVCRNDNRLSVEGKMNSKNEDDSSSPGGSAQTRDYYSDSSSRRRRSFDQSSSGRKGAVIEVDEMKSISNAKVSPTTIELFHGAKVLITERDLRDSNLKDDRSESLDSASKDAASVAGGGGHRKGFKKNHRWRKAWTIWGLIHKRSERKYEDLVDGSPAESWLKPGREANGEAKEGFPDKVIRSNSSGSSKNSSNLAGSFRSMTSSAEIKGHGKKKREHLGPERNRSARYSPNNLDNGLLRFYLTPLRSSRSKCGKSRLKNSHSISRGVLRLY